MQLPVFALNISTQETKCYKVKVVIYLAADKYIHVAELLHKVRIPPSPFSTPKPNECKSYLFKTIRFVDEAVECIINLSIERADNKSHKITTFSYTYLFLIFFLGGGGSLCHYTDL